MFPMHNRIAQEVDKLNDATVEEAKDEPPRFQMTTEALMAALHIKTYPHTSFTKMQIAWRLCELDNPRKLLHSLPEPARKRAQKEFDEQIAAAGGLLAYTEKHHPQMVAFVKMLVRGLKTIANGFTPGMPSFEEVSASMPVQTAEGLYSAAILRGASKAFINIPYAILHIGDAIMAPFALALQGSAFAAGKLGFVGQDGMVYRLSGREIEDRITAIKQASSVQATEILTQMIVSSIAPYLAGTITNAIKNLS